MGLAIKVLRKEITLINQGIRMAQKWNTNLSAPDFIGHKRKLNRINKLKRQKVKLWEAIKTLTQMENGVLIERQFPIRNWRPLIHPVCEVPSRLVRTFNKKPKGGTSKTVNKRNNKHR